MHLRAACRQRALLAERIEQLYTQLQEGRRELNLLPDNVQAVVETALELAKQPPLQKRMLHDPHGKYAPIEVFDVPELSGSWAASVEWLCDHYGIPCPSWVYNSAYALPEPWFDSPGAHKPQVRERLLQQTPEPFARRNVFCGNRMFANKYEFAEHYQHLSTTLSSTTPTLS
jgi:hypothetical protein